MKKQYILNYVKKAELKSNVQINGWIVFGGFA